MEEIILNCICNDIILHNHSYIDKEIPEGVSLDYEWHYIAEGSTYDEVIGYTYSNGYTYDRK